MKQSLIVTITLFTASLFSANAFADIQAYRVSPCQYWMPNYNGGFVCQNMPYSILVPDAYSVADSLNRQSDRIAELEKKIGEIEALCKKP